MDSNHYYKTVDYQSKHLQVKEMKKVEEERREDEEEKEKYTFKEEFLDNKKYSKVIRSMSRNILWSV